MMRRRGFAALVALVAALLLVGGCGGSSVEKPASASPARTARATFTIEWPDPSRLVPIASRGVQVEVLQKGTAVAKGVAARGSAATTTIALENIPAGDLTFRATAFPEISFDSANNSSVSGVPQATGTAPMTTEAGKTAKVQLTMNSTIVRLAVVPASVKTKVFAAVTPLVATGYDATNRIVMTDAARQFVWTSSAPDIVSVGGNNNGVYRGESKGTATLTVRDKETTKTATAKVEVVDKLPVNRVTVSPTQTDLAPGGTVRLTARALDENGEDLGYTADRFTWTTSDAAKANVSATGLVTASADGTASITATERETGKSASASVNVSRGWDGTALIFYKAVSGSADVTVHLLTDSDGIVQRPPLPPGFGGVDPTYQIRFSGDGSRLFYLRTNPETSEQTILMRSADGGESTVALRSAPGSTIGSFIPSFDGRRIAYFDVKYVGVEIVRSSLKIYTIATATTVTLPFDNLKSNSIVAAAPDLDRFLLTFGEATQVFTVLVDLNGAELHRWTGNGLNGIDTVRYAQFSGDGKRLVVAQAREFPDFWRVQIWDRNGQAVSQPLGALTEAYGLSAVLGVALHPRRGTILYLVGTSQVTGDLRELSADGKSFRVLATGFNGMFR